MNKTPPSPKSAAPSFLNPGPFKEMSLARKIAYTLLIFVLLGAFAMALFIGLGLLAYRFAGHRH